MTNEKHISIDRGQYDLQTAELCDLRACFARLYDETPIDVAWLVACGGDFGDGVALFGDGDAWIYMSRSKTWWLERELVGIAKAIRTRGEFRRAAELLGIEINKAANAAEGE